MRYAIPEAVRRLYHELVRRRARLRVVAPAEVELSCTPIFLTGVFRSGTTLLRYVVDSHSRICCPPESNFLRALGQLQRDRSNREGLQNMGFDREHVALKSREFAAYFFGNYARASGKPRWADKSPSYTGWLEEIDRIFPTARHVMLLRHGLDVANSISRGGRMLAPYVEEYLRDEADPRVRAAAYWADHDRRMLDFMDAHAERCFALRYERMCERPEASLKEMFTFLNEPWEPGVLEYWRFPHDHGAEDGRAGATRGFDISTGNYRAWPQDVIDRAAAAAAPVLSRLGYAVERAREG